MYSRAFLPLHSLNNRPTIGTHFYDICSVHLQLTEYIRTFALSLQTNSKSKTKMRKKKYSLFDLNPNANNDVNET